MGTSEAKTEVKAEVKPEASQAAPAVAQAQAAPAQPVAQPPATELPPQPGKKLFLVEHGDKKETLAADNDRHAWALFCDKHQFYPSPKTGKVFCGGKQVYPPIQPVAPQSAKAGK